MIRYLFYFSSILSLFLFGIIIYSIIEYLNASQNPLRHEILTIAAYGLNGLFVTTIINLIVRYFFNIQLSQFKKILVWFPLFVIVLISIVFSFI
jgi:hypothetical protein